MARPPLPNVRTPRTPRGSTRGGSRTPSTRRRKRKIDVGDIAEGVLGAIGSLFGGRSSRSAASSAAAPASLAGGGSRGTGKANYGPLPSFNVRSKTVRKYSNPTLAIISLQITELLREMGLIESTLMEQFRQQQHIYKENARVQREINAESQGAGFVPFVPSSGEGAQLGALSVKQLNDSFMQFSKALDDAAEALNNMDCSCGGDDIDIDVPFLPGSKRRRGAKGGRGGRGARAVAARAAARTARLIEAGKATRFVSPADALNKKGLVKPGYSPVFNKRTGAVAGYKESAGWGGKWARRAGFFSETLGRGAEKISDGINAVGSVAKKYIANPVANLVSKSAQMIKGLANRGASSVSQSPFTKSAAKLIKGGIDVAKRAGSAIKSGVKAVGKFVLRKGMTIAFIAYESWNAYQDIKALPADLTPRQRKSAIAKIIGKLVASIGLIWAGAAIGTLLGTAVPGPGWLVGFLGGLIGGIAAELMFGNSVDELVENIIDVLYPTDKEIAKKVPEAKKEVPMPIPMAASAQGEGTVPYKKPSAATAKASVDTALKSAPKDTVGSMMNATAARVGVDPALMTMIASDNPAFDPKKQLHSANGSEIFKLTPQQWSHITSQYGPKYPELYAGINDPKAATTAGALLIKDSQEFLKKNNIPTTPLSVYGSYLFGYEGIRKLMSAQPSEVASKVLPEAALAKPELFKDQLGSDITAGTLVQKLYNKTLPPRQVQTTPQGVPAVPPAEMPKVDGLKQPAAPPSDRGGGTGGAGGGGGTGGSAAEEITPKATPDSGGPTPSQSTTASPLSREIEEAAKEAQAIASNPKVVEAMGGSAPATPVPPSPAAAPGAAIDEKTREIEDAAKAAQAIADNPVVIQAMGGAQGKRTPSVLPSKRAGYTGTGNVPDPTYIFMDQYEYQFRYKSSPVQATSQMSWT